MRGLELPALATADGTYACVVASCPELLDALIGDCFGLPAGCLIGGRATLIADSGTADAATMSSDAARTIPFVMDPLPGIGLV